MKGLHLANIKSSIRKEAYEWDAGSYDIREGGSLLWLF